MTDIDWIRHRAAQISREVLSDPSLRSQIEKRAEDDSRKLSLFQTPVARTVPASSKAAGRRLRVVGPNVEVEL